MNEQIETEQPNKDMVGPLDTPDFRIRYFQTLVGCTEYIKNFNIKGGEWGFNNEEQCFILVYRPQ